MIQITSLPQGLAPVICDFGWDSNLQGLAFNLGGVTYPPTAPAWSSTTAYMPGADVFYSGNEYVAIAASTNVLPTVTTSWQKVPNRFLSYQTPLTVAVVFDAIDNAALGLPKVVVPAGLTIVSYQWDFGNGQVGFGPTAQTSYTYTRPVPSIQVKLTVTDSVGRTFACAHRLNLQSIPIAYAVGYRVHQGANR